jgi:hypothetical protein
MIMACLVAALLVPSTAANAQTYVGDDVCATCHADFPEPGFFDAYMRSGHPWKVSRTEGMVPLPNFWPFTPVPPLPVANGVQLQWSDIEYVIGNFFWKTRFIDRDGYIYTGDATESTQWNIATQEFVPYHAGETDKPFDCGRCHTTGYTPVGNQHGLPGLIGTWAQDGIRCEACHGPSSNHVDSLGSTPPPGGKSCSSCHIRDTGYRMPWKSGFMRHHQQSEDWVHSPHFGVTTCNTCHNPHKSTTYEEGGLISACSDCHAGDAANGFYDVPGMGAIECKDCHMPFMAKSAVASNAWTGDVRGHLWDIMTAPTAAADNTYMVGSSTYWNQDANGDSQITLDYACLGCHTDVDGLTLASASIIATGGMHDTPVRFANSLHTSRAGKNYWYGTANGGFESFTGVPIEDLGCTECHGPTDANGDPYPAEYEPGCVDCHATGDWSTTVTQCYSCHGRQKTEAIALGYTDVHRDAGMVCWDCHLNEAAGVDDLHQDGTQYQSMLEPGAIGADCVQCHDPLPPIHDSYDPHGGDLHCTACHAQTVISCYNCHFESQVEAHVKRAKQPLHDFVMLVNREKDNKVYSASFQSITYQGDSFVAFGPYTAHTITLQGRTCSDCHQNFGGSIPAIEQYNATGEMKFAEWDDPTKTLTWLHGIVPIPEDYETTLKMDFLTYTGLPSDPPSPDPTPWTGIGEDTWDGHQMFFATPLTRDQMTSLGFEEPSTCPSDIAPPPSGDGFVDVTDLLWVLGTWGTPDGDVSGDGQTDVTDLLQVLADWGGCPP